MPELPKRREPRPSGAGVDAQVAENVAALRTEKGWSQNALATRMREIGQDHWRQTTVSRVENGAQGLTVGELRALTELLGQGVVAGSQVGRVLERTFGDSLELRARRIRAELREVVQSHEALLKQSRDVLADLDDWLDDAPE